MSKWLRDAIVVAVSVAASLILTASYLGVSKAMYDDETRTAIRLGLYERETIKKFFSFEEECFGPSEVRFDPIGDYDYSLYISPDAYLVGVSITFPAGVDTCSAMIETPKHKATVVNFHRGGGVGKIQYGPPKRRVQEEF
jgi:hypothetical protein